MSYRQVLETRQRGLSELEVIALLNQLLVELARSHTVGQAHGDLSLDSLWRDLAGDLYMNPPLGAAATQASPRTDVAAIATVAIELLTAQPHTPDWQQYCSINPALAEVLEQARSGLSFHAPQDAAQFLQALYWVQHPNPSHFPHAAPSHQSTHQILAVQDAKPNSAQNFQSNLQGQIQEGQIQGCRNFLLGFVRKLLFLVAFSAIGWFAYDHFNALIFEKISHPKTPEPTSSPSPSDRPKSPDSPKSPDKPTSRSFVPLPNLEDGKQDSAEP